MSENKEKENLDKIRDILFGEDIETRDQILKDMIFSMESKVNNLSNKTETQLKELLSKISEEKQFLLNSSFKLEEMIKAQKLLFNNNIDQLTSNNKSLNDNINSIKLNIDEMSNKFLNTINTLNDNKLSKTDFANALIDVANKIKE